MEGVFFNLIKKEIIKRLKSRGLYPYNKVPNIKIDKIVNEVFNNEKLIKNLTLKARKILKIKVAKLLTF